MKMQHKKDKKNRTILIALSTLGAVAVIYILVAVSQNLWPFAANESQPLAKTEDSNAKHNSLDVAAADDKAEFLDAQKTEKNDSEVENQPTVESNNFTVSLKQNEAELIISSKLSNSIFSSGNCSLSLVGPGPTIERSSEIIYQPEYSTCAGFSIAKTDLKSGIWTLSITAKSTSGESLTERLEVEIE